MNLYELEKSYEEALEIPDQEQRNTQLAILQKNADNKIDNLVKFTRNIDGDLLAVASELDRLTARKKQLENKKDWLIQYLQGWMDNGGVSQIKTDLFKISLLNNPPSVKILDETRIPEKYKTTEKITKINKTLIKSDITEGVVPWIEGCEIIKNNKHLKIS